MSMIDDIKKNKCYCKARKEVISLSKCDLECNRWKSCMKDLNKKYDEEVKNR